MKKNIIITLIIVLTVLLLLTGSFFIWVRYAFHSSHSREYGITGGVASYSLEYDPDIAAKNISHREETIKNLQETGESPVFLEYQLNAKEELGSFYLSKGGMEEKTIEVNFTELDGKVDAVLYRAVNYEPKINVYTVQWEEVYRVPVTETGVYEYNLSEQEDGVYKFSLEPDGEVTSNGEMLQYTIIQNRLAAYNDFTIRFESFGVKLLSFFGEKPEDYDTDLFSIEY